MSGAVNNGSKTRPELVEKAKRAAQALELRQLGMTFEQIAERVGYNSPQAAFDAVKRALDKITREPATALLELELKRLDQMWLGIYPSAIGGDMNAISSCMKLMERRAKLLGLDAPVKSTAEIDTSINITHDADAVISKLSAIVAADTASANPSEAE